MKITTKQTAFISVIAIILLALAISTAAMISQTSLGIQEKVTVTTSNYSTDVVTTTNPNTTQTAPTTTVVTYTTTTEQETENTTITTTVPVKTSLGHFKITVYCPSSDGGKWGYQTSTGVKSVHLKTCAVDPKVIPLGSTIKVNGLILEAVDTGSKVKGNVIDIFYDGTKDEAMSWVSSFGTRHEVFIIE